MFDVSEEDLRNSFTDEFGVQYSQDGTKLLEGNKELTEYTIRDGVRRICSLAFSNSQLEFIDFPESLEVIGTGAFSGSMRLLDVDFPSSLKEIEARAFEGCISFFSLDLPSSLEKIGRFAFAGCTAVPSVTIPYSVCEIIDNPFCASGIFIDSESPDFYSDPYALYDYTRTKLLSYFGMTQGNHRYKVQESVEEICPFAFAHSFVSEVTLPEGLRKVGHFAFRDSKDLKSVEFGNSLEEIGNYSFAGCDKLKSLIFPASLRRLGEGSLYLCESLRDITFLSPDPQIEGLEWFDSLENLQTIHVPSGSVERYAELFDDNLRGKLAEFGQD